MLTTLGLIIFLQAVAIAILLRYRQRKKRVLRSLRDTLSLQEQRLTERTEKWRLAAETLEQTGRQHQMTMALLNETKEYLNSIINSMPSVMIGVTPSGHVTHWNASAELATGIRERQALGFRLREIYAGLPVPERMITDAIAESEPQSRRAVKVVEQGNTRFVDITVYPLHSPHLTGAVIRIDDVTLRQQLDGMMVQNEKLRSLGELAAGMAHEINNPLAAILQSLQNVQRRLNPDNKNNQQVAEPLGLDLHAMNSYLEQREILRFLNGMDTGGRRAAEIVRNMLEFSRSSSKQLEPTQINTVVERSLEFTRSALELSMPGMLKRLKIDIEAAPDLPRVPASALEIQQVLVNLMKNGAQAIQEAKPAEPHLQVTTRLKESFVEIRVSDNGIGMSQAISRQIFDPFFTTKTTGQGTGLGLSISHFIICQRHNGRIEVESEPGQGTTFIISLPLQQPH
jgi:two-component system NtrC family sensor kinase